MRHTLLLLYYDTFLFCIMLSLNKYLLKINREIEKSVYIAIYMYENKNYDNQD